MNVVAQRSPHVWLVDLGAGRGVVVDDRTGPLGEPEPIQTIIKHGYWREPGSAPPSVLRHAGRIKEHDGPGPHKSGSPQAAHGGGGGPSLAAASVELRVGSETVRARAMMAGSVGYVHAGRDAGYADGIVTATGDYLLRVSGGKKADRETVMDAIARAVAGDASARATVDRIVAGRGVTKDAADHLHGVIRDTYVSMGIDAQARHALVLDSRTRVYPPGKAPWMQEKGRPAEPAPEPAPEVLDPFALLLAGIKEHYGPGPHPKAATPQGVHAGGRMGRRARAWVAAVRRKGLDPSKAWSEGVDKAVARRSGYGATAAAPDPALRQAGLDDLRGEYERLRWKHTLDVSWAGKQLPRSELLRRVERELVRRGENPETGERRGDKLAAMVPLKGRGKRAAEAYRREMMPKMLRAAESMIAEQKAYREKHGKWTRRIPKPSELKQVLDLVRVSNSAYWWNKHGERGTQPEALLIMAYYRSMYGFQREGKVLMSLTKRRRLSPRGIKEAAERLILLEHLGPGPHPVSGTPQLVHAGGRYAEAMHAWARKMYAKEKAFHRRRARQYDYPRPSTEELDARRAKGEFAAGFKAQWITTRGRRTGELLGPEQLGMYHGERIGKRYRNLEAAMTAAARNVRNLPAERAYIITDEGQVLYGLDGDKGAVNLEWIEFNGGHMRGRHLIHNHPDTPIAGHERTLNFLSDADFRVAVSEGMASITAVTASGHAWTMSLDRRLTDAEKGQLTGAFDMMLDLQKKRYRREIEAGMDAGKATELAYLKTMTHMATNYGSDYGVRLALNPAPGLPEWAAEAVREAQERIEATQGKDRSSLGRVRWRERVLEAATERRARRRSLVLDDITGFAATLAELRAAVGG